MNGGTIVHSATDFLYDSTLEQTYVLGQFHYVGYDSNLVNGTAIWKNGSWSPMGSGITAPAYKLPRHSIIYNGSMYMGGAFIEVDGLSNTTGLANWVTDQWEPLASISSGQVLKMEVIENELHVLGNFDSIAGLPMHNWGIWDGNSWRSGDTVPDAIAPYANAIAKFQGKIYVGGNFHPDNGPHDIAKLGPNGWEAVGGGIFGDPWVNDMLVYNDLLFVAGNFFNWSGNAATGVMAWNGSQWLDPFPPIEFLTQVDELEVIGGRLVMNGKVRLSGSTQEYGMAWYDGEQICIFGGENIKVWAHGGVADTVYASFCQTLDCEPNGPPVNRVAKWVLTNPADTCISLSVGVAEMEDQSPIALFPNPAQDHILIQFAENSQGTLQLYDLLGRNVFQSQLTQNTLEFEIDVSVLDAGQYLLTWQSADGTEVWNSRLVVTR